ncbi:hypothetical protein RHSP_70613 [Rhizobium freirei PRF 81]|uniref:Uncharacterized protein n=1 Tax=Rhizobium freirei PRF 81 TaxID=363754 RepID=N6UYS2_9HYPH|nr:hypothetical protein RHSP_70613 [Rhizobium freirei PRF 81]
MRLWSPFFASRLFRHRTDGVGSVVLRTLALRLCAGRHVIDRLGDVCGMVADALDVLGAEEKMRAGGDVARIFHHVGQHLAEERGVHGVDFFVAFADRYGLVRRTGSIDVQNFLELAERQFGKMLDTTGETAWNACALHGDDTLGSVLAEIADTLQVGGDTDRAHDLAQVGGHRLTTCDGDNRLVTDFTLGMVKNDVVGDDLLCQSGVAVDQRADAVADHLLRQAAHFRNAAGQELQVFVIGRENVGGDHFSILKVNYVKGAARLISSTKTAHDVILRAEIVRIGEHLVGIVLLNQMAEMEHCGALRDASCLLHGMRHDDDGEVFPQLVNEILDLGGCDRIER